MASPVSPAQVSPATPEPRPAGRAPTVTILSAAYNHGAYVAQCLDSILAQTYGDWELLILDDGSTDDTWEIIQSYMARDPRIRGFTQANTGIMHLAANLNALLARARGRFIATVATDDYWPADRLERQVPRHERDDDLLLSYGRVQVFNSQGSLREYPRPPSMGEFDAHEVLGWLLTLRSAIQPVGVMMSAAALRGVGGFQQYPDHPVEDYPTYMRLLSLPGRVYYHDATLGFWRVSDTQVTNVYATGVQEAALDAAIRHFDALPPADRAALPVTRDEIIEAHYHRRLLPAYVQSMRTALVERDRERAVAMARKLLQHGRGKRWFQGLCGWLASHVGFDLEWIFRAYGTRRSDA